MQTLVTPGDPGYRPPRRSLYNRLFRRNQNQPLDPLDPDKEEFPIEGQAVNLENLAINDSVNEPLSNLYEDMSDVSSVNSDEILQEAQNLHPPPPPIPEFVRGRYNYTVDAPPKNENYVFVNNRDNFDKANWYKKGDPIDKSLIGTTTYDELEKNNLLNGGVFGDMHHNQQIATMSDETLNQGLIDYGIPRNLSKKESMQQLIYKLEDPSGIEQNYAPIRREQDQKMSSYLTRIQNAKNDLEMDQIFMDMDKDTVLNERSNPTPEEQLKIEYARGQRGLQEANQARLSRQNTPQQPYPENWNPQANTSANRAWGAQNIANMEAEMAQEQARVSGLGTAARNAQAAEALPGAAARAGNAVAGEYTGLSNFAARTLPIINLGLLGYGLYNQAKANRENERYKKTIEGNQI